MMGDAIRRFGDGYKRTVAVLFPRPFHVPGGGSRGDQPIVAAAELRRETALYIMFVELLPNCRGPLITDFCVLRLYRR